jgi:hypothetical protein
MKVQLLKTRLVLIVAVSSVALGLVAYAATTAIVAVGTIPHSDVLNGPATVTFLEPLALRRAKWARGIIIPGRFSPLSHVAR